MRFRRLDTLVQKEHVLKRGRQLEIQAGFFNHIFHFALAENNGGLALVDNEHAGTDRQGGQHNDKKGKNVAHYRPPLDRSSRTRELS